MSNINIGDPQFDSHDVINKIESLEGDLNDLRDGLETLLGDLNDAVEEERIDELEHINSEVRNHEEQIEDLEEELRPWQEMADEFEGYGDWDHGEAIIHEDAFTEYAENLARDIYDIKDHWPYNHINWDAAAHELLADYGEVTVDGETYYMRST